MSLSSSYVDNTPVIRTNNFGMYHRNGAYPLDDSSVFDTLEQLNTYLITPTTAYPGQIVAVTNDSITSPSECDYTLYVVKSDMTAQPLPGGEGIRHFENLDMADRWACTNPNLAKIGMLVSIFDKTNNILKIYCIVNLDMPVTFKRINSIYDAKEVDSAVKFTKKFAEDKSTGKLTFAVTTEAGSITKELLFADQLPQTYDAAKLTGTVPIENLPAAAIERIYPVTDDTARLALTIASVQSGDTVKVKATNKMYFVKNDTKLGTEEAFEEYSVGKAAAVDWTGIVGKPTTLDGFGITDALKTSDTANVGGAASANKIAKLNSTGVFDSTMIKPEWSNIQNSPLSKAASGNLVYDGVEYVPKSVVTKSINDAMSSFGKTAPVNPLIGQLWFEPIV